MTDAHDDDREPRKWGESPTERVRRELRDRNLAYLENLLAAKMASECVENLKLRELGRKVNAEMGWGE